MLRVVFYLILIYLAYRILKPWVISLIGQNKEHDYTPPSSEEAELIRDPQCGTYFLRQRGVQAKIGGRTHYFCSEECRDKYLVSHKET